MLFIANSYPTRALGIIVKYTMKSVDTSNSELTWRNTVFVFRIVAQYWISHALQHGDLGRVLDPLLLLLLHPATTREAIHYFNQPRDTEKQPITAGQSVDKNERVITVKDRKPSASGSKVTDDSVQRNGSRDKLHRQNVSSTNTSRPRLPSGKSTSDWEVRRVTRSGSVQSSTSDDGKRTGQEHDPDREYDEHKKGKLSALQ